MDSTVVAWAGVALVAGSNLSLLAFFYGRLTEKVRGLEKLLNEHLHEHRRKNNATH